MSIYPLILLYISLLISPIILFGLYLVFLSPGNLVDWQMRLYLALGFLRIDNLEEKAIQPNSLDVHIGRHFAKQRSDGSFEEFDADEMILAPGDFVLGTTREYFYFPNTIHGYLQGKSSWARLGLYVESAGLFDRGFEGEGVVELTNQGKAPLKLIAGKPIAQMIFMRNLPVTHPYGKKKNSKSNYQGQTGAKQSALDEAVAG